MSEVNNDYPTKEEIKSYFAGVKSSSGLTYYDENLSASRLQRMCVRGRKNIFYSLDAHLTKKIWPEEIDDFDKELVAKGHVVRLSIPLGSSRPLDTKYPIFPKPKKPKPPVGGVNHQQDLYYDVEPVWKGEIVLTKEAQILADALKTAFERNEVDFESLKKREESLRYLGIPDTSDLDEGEGRVYDHFLGALRIPCISFFRAAKIYMTSEGSVNDLKPDVAIYDANGTALAILELKHVGLSHYISGNGELLTGNAGLNSILKQVCLYLIRSKVHFGFISDFDTTILIELDFPADGDTDDADIIGQKNDPPDPAPLRKRTHSSLNDFNFDQIKKKSRTEERKPVSKLVPFKHRIIRSTDTECTLQEAFYSLVYYQYWLQQNSSDPEVKAQIEAQVAAAEKLRKRLSRPKDEVVAGKTEIMRATSFEYTTPMNINVDKGRFKEPVRGNGPQWDGFDLLQGELYATQIYLFDFETLASFFPSLTTRPSGNKPQGKVVLKIYDFDYVEDSFDPKKGWGYEKTAYCAEVIKRYFHEVECYERIRKYNSTTLASRVNIPEVYDYGCLTFCDENSYLFGGFFILMEYVKNQPETARRSTFKSGYSQVKTLGELGISHNDITTSNIRIVDSELFLFDFSHAECAEVPVDSGSDLSSLKNIEDEFFSGDAIENAIGD